LVDRFHGGLTQVAEDVRAVLRELVKTACAMVNSAESSLLVPTADGAHLRFFVSVNEDLETGSFTVPRDESLAGYAYHTGQMVAVDKPDDHYREIDEKIGTQTREYIAVPILHESSALGVMTFMNRPDTHPGGAFSQQEIEWAQSFATLAAAGLRFYQRIDLQSQLADADLAQVRQALIPGAEKPPPTMTETRDEADQVPMARVLASLERFEGRDQEFFADLVEMVAKQLEGGGGGGLTFENIRE
jgi:GAF domain-containing protein